MVTFKTTDAKRRRYTYAERTISAISDIRRRHPRNSIHLKTLKAQIRRNAEAQHDPLGPRWHAGVSLACKALTEQGVIESEHPPGRIILTPKGKQLIAQTKHSVGLLEDHEHNPECKENLGRKVIRRLSHPSARIGRATSVATTGEDEVARRPPSKMTKAELLEENKRLREEYDAFKRENERKMAELTAELESKEDELLEGLSELDEFDSGDATLVQGVSDNVVDTAAAQESGDLRIGGNTVMQIEEPQPHPASPIISASVNRSLQRPATHSSNDLIRTTSGSFISSVSKQPTPAPSDAGTGSPPGSPTHGFMNIDEDAGQNRVDVYRDMNAAGYEFDDVDSAFDPDVTLADGTSASVFGSKAATQPVMQTHTPMSSPPRMLRRHISEEDTAHKRIELLLVKQQKDRAEFEKKLAEKDVTLKEQNIKIRQLEARLSDRPRLEDELRALREQCSIVERKREVLDDEKAKLQEELDRLKMKLQENTADLECTRGFLQQKGREAEDLANAVASEKDHSIGLEESLNGVQKELQNSLTAQSALQHQLDNALAEAEAARQTLQRTTQDHEKSLTEAREHEVALIQEVEDKQNACRHLQVDLQASIEQTNETRMELAGVQTKLYNETMAKTHSESELAAAQERNGVLEQNMAAMRNELSNVQRELQIERDGSTALHETLREVVAQRDGLLVELQTKQVALLEAQSTLVQKEAEFSLLHGQLSSSEGRVADLRASLAALEAKVQEADARNATLMEALKYAEEEVTGLKDGYEKLKMAQLAQFEEMDRRVSKKRKRASMPASLSTSPITADIDIDADADAEFSL